MEDVIRRPPSSCNQELFRFESLTLPSFLVFSNDNYFSPFVLLDFVATLPAFLLDFFHLQISEDAHVFSEFFHCEFCNFWLFVGKKLWVSSYDRYIGSHARKEVAVLGGYVSPTHDCNALWQLFELKQCVTGQILDIVKPLDRRNYCPRASAKKNHLRGYNLSTHLHGVGRDKLRDIPVIIDIFRTRKTLPDLIDFSPDERAHAIHYFLKIYFLDLCVYIELCRSFYCPHKLRRIEQYFRRNAAASEAYPTWLVLIDHSCPDFGILLDHRIDDVHCRACSYHYQVILFQLADTTLLFVSTG